MLRRNRTLREEDFAGFVDANWLPLVRYLARQIGELEAAQDLAQEALMQVWQRRRRVRSPRAYLYRAARSLLINERERRAVRARWAASVRSSGDPAPAPASPENALDAERLRAWLDAAIEALPERTREAFTLAYLQDLSYRDVAEVMGTSPKTVANQVSAALAQLRRALEPVRPAVAVGGCRSRPSPGPEARRMRVQ